MATSWTGSIELLAGAVAKVSAECVMHDMNGLHLRLEIPECELDINCYWDGFNFSCTHPEAEALISACETRLVDTVEPTFRIDVEFMALADGTVSLAFSLPSGTADLENITLIAE